MAHTANSPRSSSAVATYVPTRKKKRRPHPLLILLALLVTLVLVYAASLNHSTGHSQPSSQHATASCQQFLHDFDYTKVIDFHPAHQQIEALQSVEALTQGQPATLLQVQDTGDLHQLDVYVYGCKLHQQDPTLTTLLQQKGLVQGTAVITQAHTLSLGQLDTGLPPDADILLQPLQQNIFREYSWSHDALAQTLFPSLYPVSSRSEAEALQDQASHGENLPWSEPLATASQMASDLFQWSDKSMHTILQDSAGTIAHVLIVHQQPHLEVTVTLNRLLQTDSKGLWFVTDARTKGMTLEHATPQTAQMTIHGTSTPGTGKASAQIFDHTLTPLHNLDKTAPASITMQSNGSYQVNINLNKNMLTQPGLLLIEALPAGKSKEPGQLLLTNLLLN